MTDIERLRRRVEKYAELPVLMAMNSETDAPPTVMPSAGGYYEVALAIREVGAEVVKALEKLVPAKWVGGPGCG